MSKIAEMKALEAELAAQLKQLDALKNDKALQKEIEFEEKLKALMAEYSIGLRGIIELFDPQASGSEKPAKRGSRRARQVKTFKNPHTGEVLETKGGNNKTLKAWKQQHGAATVDGWLQ
ncbi:histone-like nucleoid-structuring protein, MvaT/MvaU family [Pseudomonas tohonis]|uniref:histone-like nucleoid-structuring protein, MvaT/MvaU family n=1 Tax=Pseudomonas tohonis TaxID=2725477 RepID=UPI001F398CE5|nr:histone-like nucleoid-structuring protein, MvaT/MvaU family [Pseudomonas tohonis]